VQRRAHMTQHLRAHAGNVSWVPATTCQDLERDPSLAARTRAQTVGTWMDAMDPRTRCRTIACWWSHVLLLERLQRTQAGLSLILEDDVVFEVGWQARLQEALRNAPPEWSLLKVCAWGNTRESDRVSDNWFALRGPIFEDNTMYYAGTCGYFVRSGGVDALLAHLKCQAITDIDAAMLATTGVALSRCTLPNAYAAYQYNHVLRPGGFESTIHGSSGYAYAAGSSSPIATTTVAEETKEVKGSAYTAYQYNNVLHPGGFESTIHGSSGYAYAAGSSSPIATTTVTEETKEVKGSFSFIAAKDADVTDATFLTGTKKL